MRKSSVKGDRTTLYSVDTLTILKTSHTQRLSEELFTSLFQINIGELFRRLSACKLPSNQYYPPSYVKDKIFVLKNKHNNKNLGRYAL